MVDKGVFNDVDLAMMIHPAREGISYMKRTSSASCIGLQVTFMQGLPHSKGSFSDALAMITSRIESMREERKDGYDVYIEGTDEGKDWIELRIRVQGTEVSPVHILSQQVKVEAEKIAQE